MTKFANCFTLLGTESQKLKAMPQTIAIAYQGPALDGERNQRE